MTRQLLAVLVVAALAGAGCGDDPGAAGDPAATPPEPGSYTATGLPPPYSEGDTLTLTVRKGAVSARATCNTLAGTADWSGGRLRLRDAAATEIGCPGRGHAQDEWLFGLLGSSPAYEVTEGALVLSGEDAEITLEPAAD